MNGYGNVSRLGEAVMYCATRLINTDLNHPLGLEFTKNIPFYAS